MSNPYPGNGALGTGSGGYGNILNSGGPSFATGNWPTPIEATGNDNRTAANLMAAVESLTDRTNWLGWRTPDWISGGDYRTGFLSVTPVQIASVLVIDRSALTDGLTTLTLKGASSGGGGGSGGVPLSCIAQGTVGQCAANFAAAGAFAAIVCTGGTSASASGPGASLTGGTLAGGHGATCTAGAGSNGNGATCTGDGYGVGVLALGSSAGGAALQATGSAANADAIRATPAGTGAAARLNGPLVHSGATAVRILRESTTLFGAASANHDPTVCDVFAITANVSSAGAIVWTLNPPAQNGPCDFRIINTGGYVKTGGGTLAIADSVLGNIVAPFTGNINSARFYYSPAAGGWTISE
jgi:hypothetical protein